MLQTKANASEVHGSAQLPLAVDLDGTLLRGDTLHEALVTLLLRRPLALPRVLAALPQGRAAFKRRVAEAGDAAAALPPPRTEFLAWLEGQHAEGRALHLVTAADQAVADAAAARFGIFASARGSDGRGNLSGASKAAWLQARFPDGFGYAGNSTDDLAVFAAAKEMVLVATPPEVAVRARGLGHPVLAEFRAAPASAREWLHALRPHQWSKNALMLVPLVLGHRLFEISALLPCLLGLLAMCLVASGTYLLNDLADLQADRQHATKRNRALAAGRIPPLGALALALALVVLPVLGAALLFPAFAGGLLGYVAVSLAYSCVLKRIPLLDTLAIAGLFMLRLALGVLLAEVPWSPWLMSFAGFFFFSMALAKRHGEVMQAQGAAITALARRGYRAEDWPLTLGFGLAAGVASLQIMILFVANDAWPSRLYHTPAWLYATPALMAVWLTRLWLLAHRQMLHDDPVVFALRDAPSWVSGVLVAVALGLAL